MGWYVIIGTIPIAVARASLFRHQIETGARNLLAHRRGADRRRPACSWVADRVGPPGRRSCGTSTLRDGVIFGLAQASR